MISKAGTFLLFGNSESNADILYGSGFASHDPYCMLKHEGRSILIISGFEVDRARRQADVDEVWSGYELVRDLAVGRKSSRHKVGYASILVAALRKIRSRSIRVAADFPIGLADRLRSSGIRVHVLEGKIFPERIIKTDDEIQCIAKVQRAAEKAMTQAVNVLKASREVGNRLLYAGRTLHVDTLRKVMQVALMQENCTAPQVIVAVGDQSVAPHNVGSGPVRPGQPVVIDIFPRSIQNHYWADMTRTFVKGKPSVQLVRQHRAVMEAQKLALASIRPGVECGRVHRMVERFFQANGYETHAKDGMMQGFIHSIGHGVGLDLHEDPTMGRASRVRFRKGMVVTVEPGLYYRGVGGVRLEDLVVVTAEGVRNLTRFSKKMRL